MQENEFEKKLQQKMDKLQVQPTEEVWQRIEAQVAAKRRKRRGVVFLFTLSGLFIAGLLFTDIAGVFKRKGAIAANEIKTKELGKDQPALPPVNNKSIAVNEINIKQQDQPGSLVENNRSSTGKPLGDQQLAVKTTTSATGTRNAYTSIPAFHGNNKIVQTKLVKQGTKGAVKMNVVSARADDIAGNSNDISNPPTPEDKANSVAVASSGNNNATGLMANKADSAAGIKKEKPLIEAVKKETGKNNGPAATKTTNKEKTSIRKWGLSVIAAGGISATGRNYLSNNNERYASDGLGSTPVTGSNGGWGNNGGGSGYIPSKTSAGITYMAGVQVYRNISAKSGIISGIQYRLFNTYIQTGQRLMPDSNGFERYGSGTAKKYNNRYHFISVPFNFSTNLFSIWQHDICLDAGLTYSRLLSTNALSFNSSQGTYYKDESMFNKSQWGLNAAIKFNLSGSNKPAFYIGPELYYSLTPLASSGVYAKDRNSYIGLRLQKNLKR